jgi:hypothetical protein
MGLQGGARLWLEQEGGFFGGVNMATWACGLARHEPPSSPRAGENIEYRASKRASLCWDSKAEGETNQYETRGRDRPILFRKKRQL